MRDTSELETLLLLGAAAWILYKLSDLVTNPTGAVQNVAASIASGAFDALNPTQAAIDACIANGTVQADGSWVLNGQVCRAADGTYTAQAQPTGNPMGDSGGLGCVQCDDEVLTMRRNKRGVYVVSNRR
jgi:hypothetical protein